MTATSVEYAQEQITIYPSCVYSCIYCWANTPLFRYRTRNPHPLEEALRLSRCRKAKTIVVSFTSDPYQPREEKEGLTRRVLEILGYSKAPHRVLILTKNPRLALERDGSYNMLLTNRISVWLGSTVTALDRVVDEPHAPCNRERLEALQEAHRLGIPTWMSIEPIIPSITDPAAIIKESHSFVDWYVLGRLNYAKRFGYRIPDGYYKQMLPEVVALLDSLGKPFLVKKELKKEVGL